MPLSLTQLAKALKDRNAQLVFVKAGVAPALRIGSSVEPLHGQGILSDKELETFLRTFLKPDRMGELASKKRVDMAIKLGELGAFRLSVALDGGHYVLQLSVSAGPQTPPASSSRPVQEPIPHGQPSRTAPLPTPGPSPRTAPIPPASPASKSIPEPPRRVPSIVSPSPGPGPGFSPPTAPAVTSPHHDVRHGPRRRRSEHPAVVPSAQPLMEELMGTLLDRNGSDIHVKQGHVPVLRIDGDLRLHGREKLDEAMIWSFVMMMTNEEEREKLEVELQVDTAYGFKDRARFRTNIYTDASGLGISLRLIPRRIPSWEELGLPKAARDLVYKGRGLFLVTGPTGSGKTTTLAALIRDINEHEYKHIITVEDPIEYIYEDNKCSITQREVPVDTPSFSQGVTDSMRQDPDILLVGELRSMEAMATTLTAAESGKLVFATVHTTSAYQTVERILNTFPAESQGQARFQLAATIICIMSQTLVPKRGGGRVAAVELMIANDAVRASIRESKPYLIQGVIESGSALGMRSLDQHLLELLETGSISYRHAFERCQNPATFEKAAAKYQEAG